METNKIYLGDCLDLFPLIPDNSIDLVCCDVPYGTTECIWDEIIPIKPMWEQLERITIPTGNIILFGVSPFSDILVTSNIPLFKIKKYWSKNRPSNFIHGLNMPLKDIEEILIFSKGVIAHKNLSANRMTYNPQGIIKSNIVKKDNPNTSKHNYYRKSHKQHTKNGYKCKFTNYPRQIMYYKKDETRLHPTQKPVALMQELVLTFSNKNDTVLDFACGSGTTAIAAINTTRKFICFEKDETHYNTAKKRINKKLRGLF